MGHDTEAGFDITDLKELKKAADGSPFARMMGLATTRLERGRAEARMTVSEDHLNLHGGTHGAVLYALADHVCSLVGNSLGRRAVMTQSSTSFFGNPDPGQTITASGRIQVEGRSLGYLEVEVSGPGGRKLLFFTANFFFLDRDKTGDNK